MSEIFYPYPFLFNSIPTAWLFFTKNLRPTFLEEVFFRQPGTNTAKLVLPEHNCRKIVASFDALSEAQNEFAPANLHHQRTKSHIAGANISSWNLTDPLKFHIQLKWSKF